MDKPQNPYNPLGSPADSFMSLGWQESADAMEDYYKGLAENGREEIAKIIIKELVNQMWTEPAPEEYWKGGKVVYHTGYATESLNKTISKILLILGAMVEKQIKEHAALTARQMIEEIEQIYKERFSFDTSIEDQFQSGVWQSLKSRYGVK